MNNCNYIQAYHFYNKYLVWVGNLGTIDIERIPHMIIMVHEVDPQTLQLVWFIDGQTKQNPYPLGDSRRLRQSAIIGRGNCITNVGRR